VARCIHLFLVPPSPVLLRLDQSIFGRIPSVLWLARALSAGLHEKPLATHLTVSNPREDFESFHHGLLAFSGREAFMCLFSIPLPLVPETSDQSLACKVHPHPPASPPSTHLFTMSLLCAIGSSSAPPADFPSRIAAKFMCFLLKSSLLFSFQVQREVVIDGRRDAQSKRSKHIRVSQADDGRSQRQV